MWPGNEARKHCNCLSRSISACHPEEKTQAQFPVMFSLHPALPPPTPHSTIYSPVQYQYRLLASAYVFCVISVIRISVILLYRGITDNCCLLTCSAKCHSSQPSTWVFPAATQGPRSHPMVKRINQPLKN